MAAGLNIGKLVDEQHRLEPWIWHNENDAKFTVYDQDEVPIVAACPILEEPGRWWAVDLRMDEYVKCDSSIEALTTGSTMLARHRPPGG